MTCCHFSAASLLYVHRIQRMLRYLLPQLLQFIANIRRILLQYRVPRERRIGSETLLQIFHRITGDRRLVLKRFYSELFVLKITKLNMRIYI